MKEYFREIEHGYNLIYQAADDETIKVVLHEAEDALKTWISTVEEFDNSIPKHPIPKPSIVFKFSGQWRIRLPKSLHAAPCAAS